MTFPHNERRSIAHTESKVGGEFLPVFIVAINLLTRSVCGDNLVSSSSLPRYCVSLPLTMERLS